jgi:hypothetical protein
MSGRSLVQVTPARDRHRASRVRQSSP